MTDPKFVKASLIQDDAPEAVLDKVVEAYHLAREGEWDETTKLAYWCLSKGYTSTARAILAWISDDMWSSRELLALLPEDER